MLASTLPAAAFAANPPRRLRVAAIITTFFYHSHAHVLLENFVAPYLFNGKWIDPGMDVVSLYVDQFGEDDLARTFAARHHLPIHPTISAALGCGGPGLAVDAVLSIGEHGKYPVNEKGQTEYPRKRFFDEIVAVFRQAGSVVPVFNDKHLSYRWDWAKAMYDTARELRIPFMAGSSVPLAQRRPPLELPARARITEAVALHTLVLLAYGFAGFLFGLRQTGRRLLR